MSISNKVPFGMLDGILVDVDDVKAGLACKCICPSCKGKLIARKGESNTHCFAHHKPDPNCKYTPETAIHLMAKQILLENSVIRVSEFDVSVSALGESGERFSESEELVKEGFFHYEKVLSEKIIENIKPDILIYKGGAPVLIVEICVTHAVDSKKLDKIKTLNISCIEIKLSNTVTSKKTLIEKVLNETENKKWIFNRKEKAVRIRLNKSLEKKLVADSLYVKKRTLIAKKEEKKKIEKRNEIRLHNKGNPRKRTTWIYCDNPTCKTLYESIESPSKCPKCGCTDSMKDCRYTK